MVCKLKRCFASFALVLLLSSVFLVPCSAEVYPYEEMALTIGYAGRDTSVSTFYHVGVPYYGRMRLHTNSSTTITKQPLQFVSSYYEPADHDRTLYIAAGIETDTAGSDSWFNGVDYNYSPSVFYADSRDDGSATSGLKEYPKGMTEGNDVYAAYGDAGEIFNFKITVPAYSNTFTVSTQGFVTFSVQATPWHITTYGCYLIDTADSGILAVVEQILQDTNDLSINFGNLVLAVNEILAELRVIGADVSTTVELLESLTDLSNRQLERLELISTSVDAIYAFLTQELEEESEQLSQEVGEAAEQIRQNANDEELYRVEMQSNYERLNMSDFTFGSVAGALELIGSIFTDIWNSLGQWTIVYTYPLMLGIILLVIGRLSKTGGGNSSRNSEHKGGDGGA